MKTYIAKIERKDEKWGGGIKVATEFFGCRANSEEEARMDTEKILFKNSSIIYVLEESMVPAEDLAIYNSEE